jgi:septal ring factor EnvC (AmiA/AmiB activator)
MQEICTMTTESKPSTGNAGRRRGLRGGAALLVVALLLGVLLLLVDFREERPDYQESARVPLTEAARALEESYEDESLLLENFKTVHERLNSAIALLGQAERLDPEDKRQIEVLEGKLRELEDPGKVLDKSPKALKQAYDDLTRQLEALAKKLENRQP